MVPTLELGEQLDREERLADDALTPEQRRLLGPRLFELACSIARDGIRDQFPQATDEEVERMLAERIALQRQFEERQFEERQ